MKDVALRRPRHIGGVHAQDAAGAVAGHAAAVVVQPFAGRTRQGVAGLRRFLRKNNKKKDGEFINSMNISKKNDLSTMNEL